MHPIFRSAVSWLLVCAAVLPLALSAQELREQPTPFSVWLDFQALDRPDPPRVPLPIWLESLQSQFYPEKASAAAHTAFRLHLRRIAQLSGEVEMRIFFEDAANAHPTVTGWTETGTLVYQAAPLGSGVGLPTSEKLVIPVRGVDYLEIAVPGYGRSVRGVFLASVRRTEARFAYDFPSQSAPDPFGNLPPVRPEDVDGLLLGRIKATLEGGVTELSGDSEQHRTEFPVQLDRRPLMAVLSFEVLNVDIAEPPVVVVNGRSLGAASPYLPDLADPGYRGEVRPMEADMRFRYTGWLRCQKVIPGSTLRAGLNQLALGVNKNAGSIAVRAVELQLKHNWQNLDYTLTP